MSPARRKRPSSPATELTERTRREGRELSRRRRAEARRLGPVFAPLGRFAAWIAPRTGELVTAVARATRRHVTPLSTVAFVGVAAAIGFGVSQFFDYHGVAVDASNYAGSVGATAPAPLVGTKTAGSAHLWVLIPVAVAAVVLIIGAFGGDRRLAGAVALCGLLDLTVALAIDLPRGLDAGRPGLAFSGSEAELLQGFWAEVAYSAVLVLCGGLLAHYSRGVAPARRGRSKRLAARDRVSRKDGGISPGLQTES